MKMLVQDGRIQRVKVDTSDPVVPPEPCRCAQGLATETGKIGLLFTVMERIGCHPLPSYIEPEIPEEVKRRYPLTNLSGCRVRPYHHAEFRPVASFRGP